MRLHPVGEIRILLRTTPLNSVECEQAAAFYEKLKRLGNIRCTGRADVGRIVFRVGGVPRGPGQRGYGPLTPITGTMKDRRKGKKSTQG